MPLVPRDKPDLATGCYVLDLYCKWDHAAMYEEYHGYPQSEYTGISRGDCLKQARRDGWTFHRDHTATCLKCKLVGG